MDQNINIDFEIVSNLINPNDALSYSPNFVYWLNKILFLIIYIGILYLFITLNESFIFLVTNGYVNIEICCN